jgi:hypothetical protein
MDANITKIPIELPIKIPNRQYFLETEVFNFKGGKSESVYHGGTYTGYLKIKNGGIKIIKGKKDDEICEERELIIDYLKDIISKKEQLNVDDIPMDIYYKALEGKYIRNLMCPSNNEDKCDANINNVLSKAYKLTKIGIKTFKITNLDLFKQSAPQIYRHIKEAQDDLSYYSNLKKLVKKYNRNSPDTRELNSEGGNIYRDRKSERDSELEKLREFKRVSQQGLVANGGYLYTNPNTGEVEDRGEFGQATLDRLARERKAESRGMSREAFENARNLSDSDSDSDDNEDARRLPMSNNRRERLISRKASPEITEYSPGQRTLLTARRKHSGGHRYTDARIGAYRGGSIDDQSLEQLRIELGR